MKTAIIAHGWSGSPDEPMLKWVRQSLQGKGYTVIAPSMPHPDTPTIEDWVECLTDNAPVLNESVCFIGHSVGCQTILRYLETIPEGTKVGTVVLIAPWVDLTVENLDEEEEESVARPWMDTPIDFEKVKTHIKKIVVIFSTDDPYVPLESNKQLLEEKLDAKTIILENKGHFTESDDVVDLPELLEEILE